MQQLLPPQLGRFAVPYYDAPGAAFRPRHSASYAGRRAATTR
jgi:hypothetical protein